MQAWCQKEAEQQTCMNEAASSDPADLRPIYIVYVRLVSRVYGTCLAPWPHSNLDCSAGAGPEGSVQNNSGRVVHQLWGSPCNLRNHVPGELMEADLPDICQISAELPVCTLAPPNETAGHWT